MTRIVGANIDRQPIEMNDDGEITAVGGVAVVQYVRPYDRIGALPPWGFVRFGRRLVGEAADGRLLCPHCTRWRTLAELRADGNACPIGIEARPGALVPMPGNGQPLVDVTRGWWR